MKTNLSIYLSGSIRKGDSDARPAHFFWTEQDEELIENLVAVPVRLLNPAKTDIKRNDYFGNYGCDLYLVSKSDLIIVDLRTEKGIGVGAELMFAQYAEIPVIGWLPPDTYYHRATLENVFGENLQDWYHPFAYALCDEICLSLEDTCRRVNEMNSTGNFTKNKSKSISRALRHFTDKNPTLIETLK